MGSEGTFGVKGNFTFKIKCIALNVRISRKF